MFDILELKTSLPLSKMFAADGHELRRSSGALVCLCPFHAEQTPSCRVDDARGRFRCFGCGASGDLVDYYELSRGVEKRVALEQLAAMAGHAPQAAAVRRAPNPAPPAPPEPLDATACAAWLKSVDRLAADSDQIQRIADWRGVDPAAIAFFCARGIMGLHRYAGRLREAFLVEMPGDPPVAVSIHCRLAADSPGNHGAKQSWRYDPPGCGSWPLVVGDLATARHIFVTEGQWDALALISVMGWHAAWPEHTAVVGLRGATSYLRFLQHPIPEDATVFAFPDADAAGDRWSEPGEFLEQLTPRVRSVSVFQATTRGWDLNDSICGGLTREDLLAFVVPKLILRRRPKPPTFLSWCRACRAHPEHGPAARLVLEDANRPRKTPRRHAVWSRHWASSGLSETTCTALETLWAAYRTATSNP